MKDYSNRMLFAIFLLCSYGHIFATHFMHQPGASTAIHSKNGHHTSSVTLSVYGGSTSKARNSEGNKTELLDLFGAVSLSKVFKGVNLSSLPTNLETIAETLRDNDIVNKDATYGTLSYSGKFKIINFTMIGQRDISEHFSVQFYLPVRHFEIQDVKYKNLTNPLDQDTPLTDVLDNLDSLLAGYNLTAKNVKVTSLGDMQVNSAVSFIHQGNKKLGDAALTVCSGVSIPTARQKKFTEAFYLPVGNNGHVGFILSATGSLELCSYLTLLGQTGGQFFLKRDGHFRMRTDTNQSGSFIKLASGGAREDWGRKIEAQGGLLFHNFLEGFSFDMHYRYERQGKTTLTPYDTTTFNTTIVNADEMLQSWTRHMIILNAKYQFSPDSDTLSPCIEINYKQPVKGKRILNTFLVRGTLGLYFTWNF